MRINFLDENNLRGWNFLNIPLWISILWKAKIIQFLFVGGTGVLIQLLITYVLTQLIFGINKYYIGYSIGLVINWIYNFVMHTFFTFKSKTDHWKRLMLFTIYSLFMTLFQYGLVRGLTYLIGDKWYLLIISTVILIFSVVSYAVFKLWLFKD